MRLSVVVDCADGSTAGTSVYPYPSGDDGVLLHPRDPHLARQNPADYLAGLHASVTLGVLVAFGVVVWRIAIHAMTQKLVD